MQMIGADAMNQVIENTQIKYKKIELEQRSKDWLEFRKGKIGASQVAAILGIDPYKTPLQLWNEVVFDTEPEPTMAMKMGSEKEQEILEWVNQDERKYQPAVLQSIEYPWAIASLDGFNDEESPSNPYLLEIKTTNKKFHEMIIVGDIPPHFYAQMQFQMFVSGSSNNILVSSFFVDKRKRVVWRDQQFIDSMIPKIQAFRKAVYDFVPPEPCDRDRVQIDEPELIVKAERYFELDRLIQELQAEKDSIKEELLIEAKHPRTNIGAMHITRVVREGVVDYKAIPELKGVDLKPYRKAPIVSWRITQNESEY